MDMVNHAPKHLYRVWRAAHPPTLSFAARAHGEQPVDVWQAELRRALITALGEMPEPVAPDAQHLGETDQGDHLRQKWVMRTEAAFWLPFYLLRPKDGDAPRPAVIALHGHGPGKSRTVGIAETPEEQEVVFGGELDYGLQAVREGYIAFCPDMRGFGECVDGDHQDQSHNMFCC